VRSVLQDAYRCSAALDVQLWRTWHHVADCRISSSCSSSGSSSRCSSSDYSDSSSQHGLRMTGMALMHKTYAGPLPGLSRMSVPAAHSGLLFGSAQMTPFTQHSLSFSSCVLRMFIMRVFPAGML
jgi:hypothetical protein